MHQITEQLEIIYMEIDGIFEAGFLALAESGDYNALLDNFRSYQGMVFEMLRKGEIDRTDFNRLCNRLNAGLASFRTEFEAR